MCLDRSASRIRPVDASHTSWKSERTLPKMLRSPLETAPVSSEPLRDAPDFVTPSAQAARLRLYGRSPLTWVSSRADDGQHTVGTVSAYSSSGSGEHRHASPLGMWNGLAVDRRSAARPQRHWAPRSACQPTRIRPCVTPALSHHYLCGLLFILGLRPRRRTDVDLIHCDITGRRGWPTAWTLRQVLAVTGRSGF